MRTVAAMALLLLAAAPAGAGEHGCTCKFSGGDVELGKTACIKTDKGNSLARCEMVLNNTSWKILNTPCDQLQSRMTPMPVPTPASTHKT